MENCYNSRTINGIDMKLGLVVDDVMLANCDVIVVFPIYGQFGESRSRIPDAWFVKFTFSLIVIFYLTKTESRTKNSLPQLSHYCFEYRYNF